ncbi:Bifunctional aspartokinase/homoserine dehydrogenase 2 (Includes: Aspartokinase; Homoserine dehydrogenase) [Vibrio nigripulchritudo MADA3029]|uniref:bifunctional aspartate kinase/homoserine dehydrogenase II n=1 Tax=Vibrio nigripulchritudo TaxID=28173 RepID=UPI0003B22B86|nr:bifunctional aspartate kinase/homoserine dehydrogenase II [Vibrio nigripulchritudo]CCN47233.1 Bifunctional aspartokinase/homoserine dehydrogenase 2 (Includes: Aspartokinase; Homoserine dehydrogenase) [Vibrio nigripulchritudo MADA3020]CCN55995.1 Bifunctional aspartokinase/homoserine dehydrogenase 2 (Includes: Aspartokinase; Homoserine dehydrogenase) [Vibrio nigripulchritudo MADA3021]CCN59847.1 Bifunctional aspartokinase/homoserine dehydrogenase 2 (Includes: Aspartokinase; Homoserine dehydrogen
MTVERQLHKFGGSSLADAECYQRVVNILKEYSQPNDLVVVSAAGSTTNQLIAWLGALEKDGRVAHEMLQELRQYQTSLIESLLPEERAAGLLDALNTEFSGLGELSFPLTSAQKSSAMGHGELWSARLLAKLLNHNNLEAVSQDSRDFLRAEHGAQPEVDRARSYPLIKESLAQHRQCRVVITGFMAKNDDGETVLLGRNGSDYSATVIGALAEATRVTIWSDVAGVYSSDPRKVSDACLLPLLRLDEASELARLAAPVLHSRTLQPVAQSAMELHLRCSYQPESGSTRIERVLASGRGAKIITSLDEVLLVKVDFGHGHDFDHHSKEVLTTLTRAQLSPLAFEAQEDQGCLLLAYTSEVAGDALSHLQDVSIGAEIKLKEGYSLVAAVGAGVTNNPNHCYGFYQQLKNGPVEFISEAESGLSLVAILRKTDTSRLITGIHSQLFQAQKRVAIALCGKGNIGSSWLELFSEQKDELEKRYGKTFDLVAVVDSQTYWLDFSGIDANEVFSRFDDEAISNDGTEWLDKLAHQQKYDEVIVLDVTASEALSDQYVSIAEHGFHLISANKVAGSAPGEVYHQVQDAFSKTGRHWFYNATVGAGLPVNHTVRDLRESGDDILALSGIFSGTLSWLFQQFDGQVPFSDLVDLAWQQGLTEPDPRCDLDGSDVMRKLVILARESGLELEPENVKVESLVPESLRDLPLDDFLDNGQILSELLAERLEKAQREDKVLRYVARLEKDGKASVGVEALPREHALANLLPCDNIFAIESKWYKDNPLVIRGPGAGKAVTAGAIQSDLNRLSGLL